MKSVQTNWTTVMSLAAAVFALTVGASRRAHGAECPVEAPITAGNVARVARTVFQEGPGRAEAARVEGLEEARLESRHLEDYLQVVRRQMEPLEEGRRKKMLSEVQMADVCAEQARIQAHGARARRRPTATRQLWRPVSGIAGGTSRSSKNGSSYSPRLWRRDKSTYFD